ncbi:Vacuole morphology and inheritance protein 14 [Colletotrichum orbiculare MAFF 240422]|uniref:Vacuole morphology and inheritance protein 14 n=1 Tax=Colletotrichum orbiculare (strain 104-T / ATCC 96160 / CBS 514.97 / LARS 414 / MAFF 240422) TaxID=1213857 RepID=A0A484FPW5_COLOR|nr:Vacuole morphology and inheritance protein 14 [Colletotrichum orbiculare MAFF 240422]
MDVSIQRALNDKLYDKRKVGALELERVIRELVVTRDYPRVQAILEQLCNEFAYAVHQPHARNGGLIGLAAAAIALGPELPRYLEKIVPPVLACFTDQDARVRYYACEAMYNIAKVAKGEILIYFNDIFDALCKLGADSELSVKNGAELLDRLIKDIVSESAASYVSVLEGELSYDLADKEEIEDRPPPPTAFSLRRFIPLLQERIWVINPFTRQFLVGWITLLDSIPDLELVTFLPDFLGGLLKFLSDPNRDVHVATQSCLDKFLSEIKRISRVKKGIAESKKSREGGKRKREESVDSGSVQIGAEEGDEVDPDSSDDHGEEEDDDDDASGEEDWIPGQDVQINYRKILEILTATLDSPLEEDSLLESLRWIVEFLDICPEEVLPFTPKILAHMLPAMASGVESIRQAAARVNAGLMDYVVSLSDEPEIGGPSQSTSRIPISGERQDGASSARASLSSSRDLEIRSPTPAQAHKQSLPNANASPPSGAHPQVDLDYAAAVNALTLLFLNDHEATRVAALTWLIMLHRKAPRKVLAFNDGTFPALLKTLSDPAEAVVTKDLQLLSQISRNNSWKLNNSSTMQLSELRKRLRNLESKASPALYAPHVATFSLCLLAQAYEQAYNLLQIFAELEMTVNILIQIDKLVQLIESPVFTYLRLQLLEPENSIGYLHIAPKVNPSSSTSSSYDRPNRLKGRDDGIIRWNELLEKFRSVQERARRAQRHSGETEDGRGSLSDVRLGEGADGKGLKETRNTSGPPVPVKDPAPPAAPTTAKRTGGLGMRQIRNLGGAVRGKRPG